VGPLLILLIALTGCSSPVNTSLQAELDQTTITSGANTTLSVTAENHGEQRVSGSLNVDAGGENTIRITHPEPRLLDTTLHPDESTTRVFTVTANTTTRRTDYELTVTYENQTMTYDTTNTVLSVTNT